MDGNLFQLIMEADGDLVEPFDAGAAEPEPATNPGEAPPVTDSPPQPDDMPPPLSDDGGGDDLSFEPGDETSGDQSSDEENQDGEQTGDGEEQTKEEKPSEKANDILNQELYNQFLARNKEVNDIIESLYTIAPVLPYEITQQNDPHISRLKAALTKGQEYVLNDFIEAKYGENLLFFKKLDTLYTALLDEINKNLKKVQL